MSDQTHDHTHEDVASLPETLGGPSAIEQQLASVMDLDAILNAATLAERTERICLDGQAERQYYDTIAELASLVDVDGNPVNDGESGERSLDDEPRAPQLQARAEALLAQVKKTTMYVRFRALPSDEWEAFEDSHRSGSNRRLKSQRTYENELIATCAVAPVITAEDVETKLRKKLNQAQIVALFNAAHAVNAQDGLDIPKSPSFLRAQKPQG